MRLLLDLREDAKVGVMGEIIDVVDKQAAAAAEQVAPAIKSLPSLHEAPSVTFYTVTEHVSLATESVDIIAPPFSPPQPDAQANRKAVQAPPPIQSNDQANEEAATSPPSCGWESCPSCDRGCDSCS